MDPLLVISNSGAGTSDEESLQAALAILRTHTDVEVQATSNPGELNSALHRAGSRRIVVAGGDGSLHAVVTTLYRRNDLKSAVLGILPLGTGNDFARANDIPLDIEEAAQVLVDGAPRADRPHRGRGRRDRGQQRARRRRRPGQPQGRQVEGPAALGRRRQGQPRQAGLPDRRRAGRGEAAVHPGRRRGRRRDGRRHGPADPDGRRRQRRPGRRRHRAHAARRPARRHGRRHGVPRDRPAGQVRVRRQADDRQAPRARRRDLSPRLHRLGVGRGVLVQRRRRDLRTRAAPHLAGRACGVLPGRR